MRSLAVDTTRVGGAVFATVARVTTIGAGFCCGAASRMVSILVAVVASKWVGYVQSGRVLHKADPNSVRVSWGGKIQKNASTFSERSC